MGSDGLVDVAASNILTAKIALVSNLMKLLEIRVTLNIGGMMSIKSSSDFTLILYLYFPSNINFRCLLQQTSGRWHDLC